MRDGVGSPAGTRVKLARRRAVAFPLLAFVVSAGILALAMAGHGSAAAQETITIRGSVVNGTAGSELGTELQVLLLVTDADGGRIHTGQALTSPDGRFVLDDVPKAEDGTYAFRVNFQGVDYDGSIGLGEALDEVMVTVYETTQDGSQVRVTRQIMVIAGANGGDREVSAIEFVQLTNDGDRTLLPDLSNPTTFLRFALPPLATDLSVRSSPVLSGSDILSIGTGFAVTSPVPPGEHSVEFSFRFPYEGNSVSYRQSLPQGADLYQVLLPRDLEQVRVRPLSPVSPVSAEGSEFLVWEQKGIGRGQGVQLELTNLPQPSLASRLWDGVTNETFWQMAVPSVLGAVLAVLLLVGVLRRPPPRLSPVVPGGEEIDRDLARREALVREVASLDDEFQGGALPEDEYMRQRDALLSRIRGISETAYDAAGEPQ